MQDNSAALQGIFDIEPPTMPAQIAFEQSVVGIIVLTLSALCALCIIGFIVWRRYFSQRGRARRRLQKLKIYFSQQQIDYHDTIFQLSSILRYGLRVQQISKNTVLPVNIKGHEKRWLSFVDHLSTLRYSAAKYDAKQITQLLDEAHLWLRIWPVIADEQLND